MLIPTNSERFEAKDLSARITLPDDNGAALEKLLRKKKLGTRRPRIGELGLILSATGALLVNMDTNRALLPAQGLIHSFGPVVNTVLIATFIGPTKGTGKENRDHSDDYQQPVELAMTPPRLSPQPATSPSSPSTGVMIARSYRLLPLWLLDLEEDGPREVKRRGSFRLFGTRRRLR